MTNTHTAPEASLLERANEAVPTAARTLRAAASSLFVLLLPKCPLCVAVYLSGLGITASAAHSVAPLVRPLALVIAIVTWLALIGGLWRRRDRGAAANRQVVGARALFPSTRSAPCCCGR
jgi:hypothetical protein